MTPQSLDKILKAANSAFDNSTRVHKGHRDSYLLGWLEISYQNLYREYIGKCKQHPTELTASEMYLITQSDLS